MNSKALAGFARFILAALLFAPAVLAQEVPGGAPGAPQPPWWPQPQPKQLKRVPQGSEPAQTIEWAPRVRATLDGAAASETPLLLCFVTGVDTPHLAELPEFALDVTLVKIDRGLSYPPASGAAETWSTQPRFLATNPMAAYRRTSDKDSFVLCDWHGNEFFSSTRIPSRAQLSDWLASLGAKVAEQRVAMAAQNELAKSLLAQGQRRKAILQCRNTLKRGYWGYAEVTEAADLLERQLKEAARECNQAWRSGDLEAMQRLQADFKGSRLSERITQRIAKMQTPEQEEAF